MGYADFSEDAIFGRLDPMISAGATPVGLALGIRKRWVAHRLMAYRHF
jgi:hypothetical protein